MIVKISKSNWEKLAANSMTKIAYNAESFAKVYPQIPAQLAPKFIELNNKIPDANRSLRNYFNKLMRNNPQSEADFSRISSDIMAQIQQGQAQEIDPMTFKATPVKEERVWITKLIKNKEINPSEDLPKIMYLIKRLKEINEESQAKRTLESFANDKELYKFVNAHKDESEIEIPQQGVQVLDHQNIDGFDVKFLKITSFEGMEPIARDTNWCTRFQENYSTYSRENPEFYCAIIDGQPEVLIHNGNMSQIKDTGDAPITNLKHVQLINSFVTKYDLNTQKDDFESYNKALEKVKEFETNKANPEWVQKYLAENPEKITFWGQEAPDVIKYIYNTETIEKFDAEQVSKSSLDALGRHHEYYKDPKIDTLLTAQVIKKGFYNAGNQEYSSKKYLKKIPTSLRNSTSNKIATCLKNIEDGKSVADLKQDVGNELISVLERIVASEVAPNPSVVFSIQELFQKITNSN